MARETAVFPHPHLLIAGLPEKYGSSLDFLLLAEELGAEVTVVDERPFALEKLRQGLAAAQDEGWLTAVSPIIAASPALTTTSTSKARSIWSSPPKFCNV
ncbi:MAG: hypothetical protein M5U34_43910 [Chloroflexi bacterium]|nr:hypothetical protein [Chloroflexota bacterium]